MSISYADFDPKSIKFGPPGKNSYGGSFVPFVLDDGRRNYLKIMTPPMLVPFGVSASQYDADNLYIDLSFRDGGAEVETFHATMKALDQHLLEAAVANAAEWFPKKKLPDDPALKAALLDDPGCHKLIVKPSSSDPKWGDKMVTKARILKDTGNIDCKFFDAKRNPITKEDIPKMCTMRLVIEASCVYLSNTGWGVTWRARQAQLLGKPERLAACEFTSVVDEDDDEVDPDFDGSGAAAFV